MHHRTKEKSPPTSGKNTTTLTGTNLGFTADEQHRHQRFTETERPRTLAGAVLTRHWNDSNKIATALSKTPASNSPDLQTGLPQRQLHRLRKSHQPHLLEPRPPATPRNFLGACHVNRANSAPRLVRVNNERIYLDELDPKALGRPMEEPGIRMRHLLRRAAGTSSDHTSLVVYAGGMALDPVAAIILIVMDNFW